MFQSKKSSPQGASPAIVERVAAVIRDNRLITREDRVVVAVSGGSDSLALLYLLRESDIPGQLLAVYIDHGLRPLEIPEEMRTVEACCRALDVPFLTRSVDVHRLMAREKRSPEEAARILRYQALEELRREHRAQLVATGHTADDQVEEFFLRLIRGSSRRGLTGMALRRGTIIRPLLHETKASLAGYLAARQVDWCRDSSNLESHFLRNRVRLSLLPLLEEEFNPAIRRTILRNMDILAGEEDYLEQKTAEAAERCITLASPAEDAKNHHLALRMAPFIEQHPALRRRILEQCCLRLGIRPDFGGIELLGDFMASGACGGELHLDDGVRVEKRAEGLLFCRPLEPGRKRGSRAPAPAIDLTVAGPGRYLIAPYGRELVIEEADRPPALPADGSLLVIDRAKVAFPLSLRSVQPGETFHPCNGPGRKKISRYFNDRKIPARERAAWPVLLAGDRIVALPGLQLDHAFRVTEATSSVLVIGWRQTAIG